MESFLVPALILLIVVAGVLTAVALSRKRSAGARRPSPDAAGRGQGPAPTREAAAAANARLDQQQHTAVYSMIARGHGLEAIQAYRKATGAALREAASAIASMSAYPQPYISPAAGESGAAKPASSPAAGPSGGPDRPAEPAPGPAPAPESRDAAAEPERKEVAGHSAAEGHRPEPPAPARPAEPASAEPGGTDVPGKPSPSSPPAATGAPAHRPTAYRYRAIVSKGDEIREISSTRLNDAVYSRIRQTALAGDLESAARLLREHSDAGEQEAREFVALIGPEED
jgi:hypothetical protein